MIRRLLSAFDARDVAFLVGLALFAAGLAQVSVAAALVGTGSVLLFAALRG